MEERKKKGERQNSWVVGGSPPSRTLTSAFCRSASGTKQDLPSFPALLYGRGAKLTKGEGTAGKRRNRKARTGCV